MSVSVIDQMVGSRLYTLRISEGLTRRQLAERVGLTEESVGEYERGAMRLHAKTMQAICAAFRVSPDYFFQSLTVNRSVSTQDALSLAVEEIKNAALKVVAAPG